MLRFSLLIVLTVGLLSIAFRGSSHSPSHNAAGSSATTTTTTLGQSGTTTTSPTTSTTTVTSPTSPGTSTAGGSGSGGSGGSGSNGSGGGSNAAGQPTLPVTGWGPAVRLGALALVLISGGALTLSAGSQRRRV